MSLPGHNTSPPSATTYTSFYAAASTFDPSFFVDRVEEQAVFETLLQFNSDARVLAIRDRAGSGKTMLLGQLEHNCRWTLVPHVPVVRVSLSPTRVYEPLGLIQLIYTTLRVSLDFRQFEKVNAARLAHDFSAFASSNKVSGTISADSANISGSGNIFAGVVIDRPAVYIGTGGEWTPDRDAYAQHLCLDAFCTDLHGAADGNPVVLILDDFEKCNSDLRMWLFNEFLRRLCFDPPNRADRLVVICAGQELPDFRIFLGERANTLVRTLTFDHFSEPDFASILHKHSLVGLRQSDLAYIHGNLSSGRWSVRQALRVAMAISGTPDQ